MIYEPLSFVLIEGAVGGVVLALIAFLLSRFVSDVAGRTVLATVLFAAAGAYFGFAFNPATPPIWLLIELLQTMGLECLDCTAGVARLTGSHSDTRCIRCGMLECTILDQAAALPRCRTRSFVSALIGWPRPTSSLRIAGLV